MQQSQAEPEGRLAAASTARARAEHVEWDQALTYSEHLYEQYAAQHGEFYAGQAQYRSISLEVAVATNQSEGQVNRTLFACERLRDEMPAVWGHVR